MIRFVCRCRYLFTVDDDMAGNPIQCPECGLLNDVPTHGDLPNLEADGTYKLDDTPVREEPGRLAELSIIYNKGRIDEEGNEIDLRTTSDDLASAGDIPIEPNLLQRPHYDPETGELIRPLEIRQDADHIEPEEIPFAKPALGYATASVSTAGGPGRVFLQLLMPVNLAVMAFLLCGQGVWDLLMFVASGQFPFLGSTVVWLQVVMLSHYGNVIDEVGPEGRDELPRPWRDLRWHEDIWFPLCCTMAALILSYAPSWLALHLPGAAGVIAASVMLLAGTAVFPAILLTLQTSGSLINLRPDRVLGTIRACGPAYFTALIGWVAAVVFFLFSTSVFVELTAATFGRQLQFPAWVDSPVTAMAALPCAVYFMHYFCWLVGLLYREHFEHFPWVLQRHIPTVREGAPRSPRPLRRSRTERIAELRLQERQRRALR